MENREREGERKRGGGGGGGTQQQACNESAVKWPVALSVEWTTKLLIMARHGQSNGECRVHLGRPSAESELRRNRTRRVWCEVIRTSLYLQSKENGG